MSWVLVWKVWVNISSLGLGLGPNLLYTFDGAPTWPPVSGCQNRAAAQLKTSRHRLGSGHPTSCGVTLCMDSDKYERDQCHLCRWCAHGKLWSTFYGTQSLSQCSYVWTYVYHKCEQREKKKTRLDGLWRQIVDCFASAGKVQYVCDLEAFDLLTSKSNKF